ncbi:MAG: hypothetical protein J7497_11385 [Chitinophagaceae bacterium]|nr:hypothetical protein [Chitinophagaceae bacterium]
MGAELLIPILIPLGFFAMVFGIVYLYKKENLAMIDKGMNPKVKGARGPEPFRNLKWGLLLVGAGMGLLLAFFIDMITRPGEPEALFFSLVAIGGGIGLILSYKMEMKDIKERRNYPNSVAAPSEL